jgi:hypothetical protein
MTENLAPQPATPPPPTPLAGVGVAAAAVTAIAGWLAVGGSLLSEASLFGGLLMLWYWANIEQLALRRLPSAILGSLVGIGVAWGMFYGATYYGPFGLGVGLFLLIIVIYLDILKVMPLFVNGATMLYSIIAAAPLVQLKVNWIELCLATIGGALFFGAFVAAVGWLGRKLSS